MAALHCPYCDRPAVLTTGARIYPHRPDLFALKFWQCAPCEAWVGCHKVGRGYGDGTRPLGRLANAELRAAKSAAHAAFDPLWMAKGNKGEARKRAYRWLAQELRISEANCHIGMFDVAQCRAVVDAVTRRELTA